MSGWLGGLVVSPVMIARIALGVVSAAILGALLIAGPSSSVSSAGAGGVYATGPSGSGGGGFLTPAEEERYCSTHVKLNWFQRLATGCRGDECFIPNPNYDPQLCEAPSRPDDYPPSPPRLVRGEQSTEVLIDQRTYCPVDQDGAEYFLQPDLVPLNRDCVCNSEFGGRLQVFDPETNRRADMRCLTGRQAANYHNRGARYWLLRGDSKLAADQKNEALAFWRHSIEWGREFGAQASLMAQRRVQAHMLQCEVDPDGVSLDRIARGGSANAREIISLEIRQKALKALGYYPGPTDGAYGPMTRDAVRGFQRELGYDETGTLTPYQTTLLICHAAQTAREPELQNALGIMYSTGLGVSQNTDLALEWFDAAIQRDDPDASFNLALIYGTGAVLGSYRLCGIVENPERADAYLREAAAGGHDVALRWREDCELSCPSVTPGERWRRISDKLKAAAERASEEGRGGEFYLDWLRRIQIQDLQSGCGGLEEEPPAPASRIEELQLRDWNR